MLLVPELQRMALFHGRRILCPPWKRRREGACMRQAQGQGHCDQCQKHRCYPVHFIKKKTDRFARFSGSSGQNTPSHAHGSVSVGLTEAQKGPHRLMRTTKHGCKKEGPVNPGIPCDILPARFLRVLCTLGLSCFLICRQTENFYHPLNCVVLQIPFAERRERSNRSLTLRKVTVRFRTLDNRCCFLKERQKFGT